MLSQPSRAVNGTGTLRENLNKRYENETRTPTDD